MKTLSPPFIFLLSILLWATPVFSQTEEKSPPAQTLSQPPFSLETTAEDSPETAKKKAALRLIKSFQTTSGKLKACRVSHAEAGPALSNFGKRNGNTLALSMKIIKMPGGISDEIREIMEAVIAEEAKSPLKNSDCLNLIREVNMGNMDIYKAARHQADYKFISSK